MSKRSQTGSKVTVMGQKSRSPRSKNVKIPVFSLVSENMVQGQGQRLQVKVKGHRSRSNVKSSRSTVVGQCHKVKVKVVWGVFAPPPSTRGRFDMQAFSFFISNCPYAIHCKSRTTSFLKYQHSDIKRRNFKMKHYVSVLHTWRSELMV